MFSIINYIKLNHQFYELNSVELPDFIGLIDWTYVEGSFLIQYHGETVFDLAIVDDINWFWGYVTDGFAEFFKTDNYDLNFPSTIVSLSIQRKKNKNLTTIILVSKNKTYLDLTLDSQLFLNEFLQAGLDYFNFEHKFCRNQWFSQKYVRQFKELLTQATL